LLAAELVDIVTAVVVVVVELFIYHQELSPMELILLL
jgi:hypothetical protein